jgi:hypothetical protein
MSKANVDAVRELFERFGEIEFVRLREALERSSSLVEAATTMGDLGRWHLERLDPEVEIDASALPGMPEGNRAHGHQGWFEFWRTWLTVWESFGYEPRRWHDGGDRVVVEFVQQGRLKGGLEYATLMSDVWTFEDDVIVRLQMSSPGRRPWPRLLSGRVSASGSLDADGLHAVASVEGTATASRQERASRDRSGRRPCWTISDHPRRGDRTIAPSEQRGSPALARHAPRTRLYEEGPAGALYRDARPTQATPSLDPQHGWAAEHADLEICDKCHGSQAPDMVNFALIGGEGDGLVSGDP